MVRQVRVLLGKAGESCSGAVGRGQLRSGMAGMAREGAASFGSLRQVRLGRDGRFGSVPVRTGTVRFGR